MALGILAVALFSVTLPATRAAVAVFDPLLVALARAEIAAVIAALVLLATRSPCPTSSQRRSLVVVAAGVVFGFPVLTSWAMAHVPAPHGAVVLASSAPWPAAPSPWTGLPYVALVGQLAAFFPWYRGLALGGIARVGQAQLLQPFFTLVASALLLAEPIAPGAIAVAAGVVVAVALSARVGQARSGGAPLPAGTMNSSGRRRRRASHARPSARRSPGAKP